MRRDKYSVEFFSKFKHWQKKVSPCAFSFKGVLFHSLAAKSFFVQKRTLFCGRYVNRLHIHFTLASSAIKLFSSSDDIVTMCERILRHFSNAAFHLCEENVT